ncbi:phage tail protein (plasmid) [Burkholderia sp. THE68]|uniref:phage tail protein n=1 Tax=Burkholderia sp. THE68 TaxID=758782 RepID=UPI001315B17E|nr:phage tail protein [Burkholderia sp. THE68]BBU33481.1 phage tail protein [Burkholderia sp. THE68]
MARLDPLRGFRFLVEIEGITSGGFVRVKGMQREVKHESFREGGVNDYEHKLVSQVTYSSVVLERGLALDDLWNWAQAAADGNVTRKTIRIRLQDEAGEKAWAWQLDYAIPVKWSSSDLDGANSQVLMESLEIAHHGLRKAT